MMPQVRENSWYIEGIIETRGSAPELRKEKSLSFPETP
jgi:hypothetical protein